jgi:hypothetical protein
MSGRPPHWIHPARRVYRVLAHPLDFTVSLPWFAVGTVAALALLLFATI